MFLGLYAPEGLDGYPPWGDLSAFLKSQPSAAGCGGDFEGVGGHVLGYNRSASHGRRPLTELLIWLSVQAVHGSLRPPTPGVSRQESL